MPSYRARFWLGCLRERDKNPTVVGMTCDSCAMTVKAAVEKASGVTSTSVDITDGKLTVTGHGEADAVTEAIARAGYELAKP